MMPIARSNSVLRRRGPELGLNRMVAFCMRWITRLESIARPTPTFRRSSPRNSRRCTSDWFENDNSEGLRYPFIRQLTSISSLLEVSMKMSVIALVLLCAVSLSAQNHSVGSSKPVTLVTGIGDAHHPVSTKNAEAQQFFDQGLRFIYAFNHDEAARSFQHAAELDPKLAMAYWGVAEAVGPNYNDPADPERYKHAHDAAQKALDLSADAPANEQAYIQAMAK